MEYACSERSIIHVTLRLYVLIRNVSKKKMKKIVKCWEWAIANRYVILLILFPFYSKVNCIECNSLNYIISIAKTGVIRFRVQVKFS